MPRIAVVGHVEWVEFLYVPSLPRPGDILDAGLALTRAAGGGGVVAAVLAGLGAEVDFFCALGDDVPGRAAHEELSQRGVHMHVAWRSAEPTRRAVTLLDQDGERAIVTVGPRLDPRGEDPLPWDRLQEADGAYFTAGDVDALRHARGAGVLVGSPRGRAALSAGPVLDALVYSGADSDERDWADRLSARARLLVETRGQSGGVWSGESRGRWAAAPAPGQVRDTYGCGDSFAAGFLFGLATGSSVLEAADLGARCGAAALARPGAP